MSPRILHVFPRSPFLGFTAGVFEEVFPGANTFLVLGEPAEGAAYEVPAQARREWVVPDADGARYLAQEIAVSDIAIFHSVGAYAASLIAATPPSVFTVWSGWGGDYYGNRTFPAAGLLGQRTRRYLAGRTALRHRLLYAKRRFVTNRPIGQAAGAVDAFSAPIPNDFAVFRRRFRGFHGRYAQLNYASVEDSFVLAGAEFAGDDILLGNSADPANNHLDILPLLSAKHSAGRRIIAPLSYGDQVYADAVVTEGRRLFGSDFVPLREFVPLAEYLDLVASCGVVVMGHRRQQAIGNVATALWGGAQVFMDARSPLYTFFRERGAGVSPLSGSGTFPTGRVSPAQRAANVRVLTEFWGRSTVLDNARALVAMAGERR
jgi:hypothetical protein